MKLNMKKYILLLGFLVLWVLNTESQTSAAFNRVPMLNGKVVFEQFVVSNQSSSSDQNYAKLQKWARDRYTGNPLLSGIRFDDKSQTVTVSSKSHLKLPANSAGNSTEMIMNYRFDVSASGAGSMLVMRDITFQSVDKDATSFFPKVYTAEQMISDQAIGVGGEEGELRNATRKAALQFVNELYTDFSSVF